MTLKEFELNDFITVVNKFDPSNANFLIDHYGFERIPSNKPTYSGSGTYALHFIRSGTVFLIYGNNKVQLGMNHCFLLFPSHKVAFKPDPENPAAHYWVTLNGTSVKKFFSNIGLTEASPHLMLSNDSAKRVKSLFFANFNIPQLLKPISYSIYYENLYRITRHIFTSKRNSDYSLGENTELSYTIGQVCTYVQEHFREDGLTLQSIADNMSMSADYLGRQFQREMGIKFTSYLANKRIHYADVLIREGETSVAKLAMMVGIPDAKYFAKIFKRANGITPKNEITQVKLKQAHTRKAEAEKRESTRRSDKK